MKKLIISLLLLVLVDLSVGMMVIYSEDHKNAFKKFFQPIVLGANASLTANINFTLNGETSLYEYTFFTRNLTHGEWATTLKQVEPIPTSADESEYRSVFSNNKLTRRNEFGSDPNYAIFEHLLTQGPQTNWSAIDEMELRWGILERINNENVLYYEMTDYRYINIRITSLKGNHPVIMQ